MANKWLYARFCPKGTIPQLAHSALAPWTLALPLLPPPTQFCAPPALSRVSPSRVLGWA